MSIPYVVCLTLGCLAYCTLLAICSRRPQPPSTHSDSELAGIRAATRWYVAGEIELEDFERCIDRALHGKPPPFGRPSYHPLDTAEMIALTSIDASATLGEAQSTEGTFL